MSIAEAMQRPAEPLLSSELQDHQLSNASAHRDTEAMPPPQLLPDSQGSHNSSDSSAPSLPSSFPSNAYASTSDPVDSAQPSSTYTQILSSQSSVAQSNDPPASNNSWRAKPSDSTASSPSSAVSGSPTHGSKRTASGTVKSPDSIPSGFNSSTKPLPAGGHSRNTSVNSTVSSVGELSAQLKTRLTYAMVKVHNGWENHSIAEVENLASQVSSPVSASTTNRTMQSPRALLASANRRSRDLTQAVEHPPPSSSRPTTSQSTQSTHARLHAFSSEPYNHSTRPNGTPSLAPAPDLKPASRDRRSNGVRDAPPALITSRPSQTQPPRTPATPTPQEQDAVDTLLFMSSPANSAHFPQHRGGGSSSVPSPRRSGLGPPASRSHAVSGSATPRLATRMSISSSEGGGDGQTPNGVHPAAKRRSLGVTFKTEKDVDLLLDQMAEMASSDEEDVELPTLSASTKRPPPYTNGAPVNVRV